MYPVAWRSITCRCGMVLFFFAFIFFLIGIRSPAQAQYVRDSAFCVDVKNNECIRVIPDGGQVSLSSLPLVSGHRRIYFWGNLRNPSNRAVAFYFSRSGACYQSELIAPDERALKHLSVTENIVGLLSSVTMSEVWHVLGLSSTEIGVRDVKANVVLIPESNEYRIHDYRFAKCTGSFSARLVDSDGEPIPGNNGVKIVIVD